MWHDEALPRLRERAGRLGAEVASRTYRLMGIGESQVAEILGDELLRRPDPEVATYARVEAVDVRISAFARPDRSAEAAVQEAAAIVEERLGAHIWGHGETTWSDAIGAQLEAAGEGLAVVEIGTGGGVAALFGDVDWLRSDEILRGDELGTEPAARDAGLLELARRARTRGGASIAVAVVVVDRGGDTDVGIAIATSDHEGLEHRTVFLGGRNGRSRAALATASALFVVLRDRASAAAAGPGSGDR